MKHLVLLVVCVLFLSACTTDPKKLFKTRQQTINKIQSSNIYESGTLAELVEKHHNKAKKSVATADYIDFYLIRQAAIEVLVRNIKTFYLDGMPESAINMLGELQLIDPKNRILRKHLISDIKKDPNHVILNRLTPNSLTARNFNLSYYLSLKEEWATSNSLSDELSLIRNGIKISYNRLTKLLYSPLDQIDSCRRTSDISMVQLEQSKESEGVTSPISTPPDNLLGAACLFAAFKQYNIEPNVHEGVRPLLFMAKFPAKDILTVADLMIAFSDRYGLNFLIGFDNISLFMGSEIPEDLESVKYAYTIHAKYVPVLVLLNAISSSGYTSSITGIDANTSVLWIAASLTDYMHILRIISSIDAPTPQIRLNIEIIEIEESLISEVGVRVPQAVSFTLGDPTFRYYNYGDGVNIGNDGLVVQSSGTGSVSMSSLLNHRLEDVVRAVIQDDGFRLAAKEQNFVVEINERPTLLLKSGSVATFDIGNRLPIITSGVSTSGAISESVTMLELGLSITAECLVIDQNNIRVYLDIEISNLLKETKSIRGTSQPHLSTRRLSTSFIVEDGDTIMLGGMTSYKSSNDQDGLPGLAKSAYTNLLGGINSKEHVKNDLIILVTPEIITPQNNLLHTMRTAPFGRSSMSSMNNTLMRALENSISTIINRSGQATTFSSMSGTKSGR